MEETVNITINNWSEDLLQELSEFTISIWKEKRPELQVERLVNWFKNLDLKYSPIALIAKVKKEIIGWIFFVQMTATEAEINPWALNGHPIVIKEYEDRFLVSKSLIAEAIEYSKTKGINRTELSFRDNSNEMKICYEDLGLCLIEQNCHMRQELLNETEYIKQFNEYEIIPISQIDKNEFFQCFLKTFRASKDLWLTDKTDVEMQNYFNEVILADDFPLIESASIGVLSNNQLIAFSIVRESHGENNGQLWIMGVDSNYRRKGIGREIIHYIKSILIQEGYKSTSLNVNLANIPALNLYLSEGYEEVWIQTSYTWKLKK